MVAGSSPSGAVGDMADTQNVTVGRRRLLRPLLPSTSPSPASAHQSQLRAIISTFAQSCLIHHPSLFLIPPNPTLNRNSSHCRLSCSGLRTSLAPSPPPP
ncbi:unnamed protein product, partial [Protopolystoma xenopodis]